MLLRTKSLCCLALAFAALLPGWCQAQELRYKFQAGNKNTYVIEENQNMKMTTMGQEVEIKLNMLLEITQTIDSVDTATGNARMKQKISRVKMLMQGGLIGTMEYDSDSNKEPEGALQPMAGIFKAMTEGEMKMTLTTRGEVSDFKMPEKLLEELKNLGTGTPGLGGANVFTEDSLKNMMNQAVMVLPKDAPVAGSTTWDRTMEMKMGPLGTIKNTTKYTYAGKSGEFDKIGMKLDMKVESDPGSPFPVKMNTKEGTGTTLFDNAKGRIQDITIKTVSEMEMGSFGSANVSQTTTMKLK